jgi:hypothetical protein
MADEPLVQPDLQAAASTDPATRRVAIHILARRRCFHCELRKPGEFGFEAQFFQNDFKRGVLAQRRTARRAKITD